MLVDAITPELYMGDVIGNLSSRRGLIEEMEMIVPGVQSVRAKVPLAEMLAMPLLCARQHKDAVRSLWNLNIMLLSQTRLRLKWSRVMDRD